MNSQEFILWLKGFVDAVNGIPTQNQWETLKEKLAEVKDEPTPSLPFGVPNNTPFVQPFHHQPFPYGKPIPVTCENNTILTATSGSGTVYGAFSGLTNGNTTSTTLPKGANVSYTANLPKELLTD